MNDKAPELRDDDPESPFPDVPLEIYWALPEADRAGIEQIIRDMIKGRNSKH